MRLETRARTERGPTVLAAATGASLPLGAPIRGFPVRLTLNGLQALEVAQVGWDIAVRT